MSLGLAIFMCPIWILIFGWIIKYNTNWYLILSNVVWGLFVIISCFVACFSEDGMVDINGYPVLGLILAVFGVGWIISIFVALGNALEAGNIIVSIIMIVIGILLCFTGIGIPVGAALVIKAGTKGLFKNYLNHKDE